MGQGGETHIGDGLSVGSEAQTDSVTLSLKLLDISCASDATAALSFALWGEFLQECIRKAQNDTL
jgi:hypothetical protein